MLKTGKARAIVVDPLPLFCDAMGVYLTRGGHTLACQCRTLEQALQKATVFNPDLLIVGPHFAESDLVLCKEIISRLPELKLVLLAQRANDVFFQADVAYMGISACLPQEVTGDEFLAVIENVVAGRGFFSREVTALAFQRIDLTPRECEVLRHVAAGKTNQEIADLLWVSVHTTRTHSQHILEKLGVHSRQEAVWRGLYRGLI